MTQASPGLLVLTIIMLGGLYPLDVYLPLGIGNGVLYGGLWSCRSQVLSQDTATGGRHLFCLRPTHGFLSPA
ncbi:MAG: hypothetical protein QM771_11600 [Nitrospira sp.]